MGLGAVGLFGGLAATGLQLYGQHQQAKAEEQAAEYNNGLARAEARNRELETAEGVSRQRQRNASALSQLSANLARSGVRAASGSALDIYAEAAGRLEIDIADAARASAMEAESLRAKGRMGLWEADRMKAAARLGMFGTALQGVTSAFGQYREGSYHGVNYRIGG